MDYFFRWRQYLTVCAACIFSIAVTSNAMYLVTEKGTTQNENSAPSVSASIQYHSPNVSDKRSNTLDSLTILDHLIRLCVFIFLSAVFAGLTLGVMTVDTFTLEIIAESGSMPDSKYAEQILPLRKNGHKTLCTLILSNMLCNVLVVQEFSSMFNEIKDSNNVPGPKHMTDRYSAKLWEFVISTFLVVITEILPMSVCKSKHSLRVAAWGAIFVHFAMILTYPVSMPLGKFLDWVVGCEEHGQIYDRKELRRLMVVQYERKGSNMVGVSKSELDLMLAAMDFQEFAVSDVMQPIEVITFIHEDDLVTPAFVEQIWLSGRSRVPVMSSKGSFDKVLVVKDLLTVNTSSPEFVPMKVTQIIKEKNRDLTMVEASTKLPVMLKIFQEMKSHMALVFSSEGWPGGETSVKLRNSSLGTLTKIEQAQKIVGLVTIEDVVEKLLNEEIYDEYDEYGPASPHLLNSAGIHDSMSKVHDESLNKPPLIPDKLPRVNFYSYSIDGKNDAALTAEQVWAVAYFLQRTVPCFMLWDPNLIKVLLDECHDQQLVPGSFLQKPSSRLVSTGDEKELFENNLSPTNPSKLIHENSLIEDQKNSSSRSDRLVLDMTHAEFLDMAEDNKLILYKKGTCSRYFTLVLGGQVELLVGNAAFSTRIFSFSHLAEDALTCSSYIPDFSAVVLQPARIYHISKELYDKYATYQFTKSDKERSSISIVPSQRSCHTPPTRSTSHSYFTNLKRKGYNAVPSGTFSDANAILDQKAYGTFNK